MGMEVTVTIAGQHEPSVTVTGETYGDILTAVDLSPQEATVLVEGRPVPSDQPITASEVTVLRLIAGG